MVPREPALKNNMRIKNICVLGLGYVGLTLAAVLADRDFIVYGIEKNPETLEKLKRGQAHFFEKDLDNLLQKHLNKTLFLFDAIPNDKEINAFVVTVGTPIDKNTKKPNLEQILRVSEEIGAHLKDGQLVILRSTVPVGTSREVVFPILEKSGEKFHLAFCPERTTEGVAIQELRELPQIIGGLDEESIEMAMDIFRRITPTTVEVASLEAAEINKMIDNAYRDLLFACANEVALIAKKLGLDGYDVIKATNLGYPRTNIAIPGFVGGACLEKDPWIFMDCVFKKTGYMPKLVKAARETNEYLPYFVLERVEKHLKEKNIGNASAKILISGFAFKGKPATDDMRGSPTLDLLNALREKGFKTIYGHDFLIKPEKLKELGITPVSLEQGFDNADVVIFMNNSYSYSNLDIENLLLKMKKGGLFFDGWHIFIPENIKKMSHVVYEGLSV